jgi:hypothetical protein
VHSDFPNTLYFPKHKALNYFLHTTTTSYLVHYTLQLHHSRPIFHEQSKTTCSLHAFIATHQPAQVSYTTWSTNLDCPQSPAHRSFQQTCLTRQFPACSWLLWNEGRLWSDSTLHQTTVLYFRFRNMLLKCIYTVQTAYQNSLGYCHNQSTHLVSWDHSSETCCLLNSFPRKTWLNNLRLTNFRRNKLLGMTIEVIRLLNNEHITWRCISHSKKCVWKQIHPIFHFMEDRKIGQILGGKKTSALRPAWVMCCNFTKFSNRIMLQFVTH